MGVERACEPKHLLGDEPEAETWSWMNPSPFAAETNVGLGRCASGSSGAIAATTFVAQSGTLRYVSAHDGPAPRSTTSTQGRRAYREAHPTQP